ncbi:MAG: HD domain-containing protein [Acidobacteria bacterium]|nr:HD domain-containing protein [Acidobacteriota bacterium]
MAIGTLTIAASILDVLTGQPVPSEHWIPLAAFTFVSGWLSVKLPSVSATISISETFVFAGTLLCGPAVGVLLCVLDALALCVKHARRGNLRWEQVLFNLAAAPFSIWCAAWIAGIDQPLTNVRLDAHLALVLGTFTLLYFLLNSWLITFAIASEQRTAPHRVWWTSFTELSVNFAAGASIAAFLVVNGSAVDPTFIGVILPLLLVIYFTYRWSLKHVETERDKVHELNRVFLSTVEAMALAIDAKDQVTHGHIRRVQRFTMALAEALGVKSQKELDALRAAALLHDTGKLAVPEYILNKPGPLTAAEFERMKVHADVGADILKSIEFPYPVEPIVRHHHERWDGTGYPKGLKGQEIPFGARILAVVDCYDALTSDRPYRPRMTRQQAEQELKDKRGSAYDPWVVDNFLKILDRLEQADIADQRLATIHDRDSAARTIAPAQLEVIAATTAEEREFNELRRDLPRCTSFESAADVLLRHLRRVIPAASFALYVPITDRNELKVAAQSGVATSVFEGLVVPVGERVSGWVFAHSQVVLNSDASLEFGPIARSLPIPLRYAAAVPVIDRRTLAVIGAFGSDPFEKDHRRIMESAATLFAASITLPSANRFGHDQLLPTGTAGRSLLH